MDGQHHLLDGRDHCLVPSTVPAGTPAMKILFPASSCRSRPGSGGRPDLIPQVVDVGRVDDAVVLDAVAAKDDENGAHLGSEESSATALHRWRDN